MSKLNNTFKWGTPTGGGGNDYTGIAPITVNNLDYTISINLSDLVSKTELTSNYYTQTRTLELLNTKLNTSYFDTVIREYQKKLTAGKNITIDNNNVISATGGGSAEVWENVSIQNTTQGFNILNIGNYKKIRIVSMEWIKIYTNIEPDNMACLIASNIIYLDENIYQPISLITNESSPNYVGGWLFISANGNCNFNVRFYKQGTFGNATINSYVGTIKVKGVKK